MPRVSTNTWCNTYILQVGLGSVVGKLKTPAIHRIVIFSSFLSSPFSCMIWSILGFTWRHKFHWGSTRNRYTVIRLKKMFTLCVDLVFGSKCVQFREICFLQCSTIHQYILGSPPLRITEKGSSESQEYLNFNYLVTHEQRRSCRCFSMMGALTAEERYNGTQWEHHRASPLIWK